MTLNTPDLWKSRLPRPARDGHKYDRGHVVIVGGAKLTGAARLAARAAARIGAGLTTIIAPKDTGTIYRIEADAHLMIEDFTKPENHLADARRNVLVLGPGYGSDAEGIDAWLKARQEQALVLDADGINQLKDFSLMKRGDVMTPHAGEFKKLFGDITPQEAAKKAGCIVVLKGAQTTITDGDHTVINDHASPYLATAGTGDVLAGMIGGLIAQGMDGFNATCAAVWMHGEAALAIGAGLVASDIPMLIPEIFARLLK